MRVKEIERKIKKMSLIIIYFIPLGSFVIKYVVVLLLRTYFTV